MCHYVTGEYEEALRLYEEGLAMDPNSVLCIWQSGMTLDRLGRLDEELARFERAVDLSRRGVLMVSFLYRALYRLERTDEARALLDEIIARSANEFIAESFWLSPAMLGDDADAKEAALLLNIEAGTGPTTLSVSVDRELVALLDDPRLGPLVRQLTLYAERP
jgi:tetratricopeptide (TPR) repeat protein